MPWGPPFPLDDAGTRWEATDRKVELTHSPSPRRLGLGFILVGVGPLLLALFVVTGFGELFYYLLATTLLVVAGVVVAWVRAQIVVTAESLYRWGGLGRPRPEAVETEDPAVEVWQPPGSGTYRVQIHDRGETFDVAESRDRARARDLGADLAYVLGCDPPR